MAEVAKDERRTIPAAIKPLEIAVFAICFTLPAVALVASPVERTPDGRYETLLGSPEEQGGYAGDPIAGVVAHLNLGALQRPAEMYVGILAATILFLATNAGLIGVSRLIYSMGNTPPAARPAAPPAPAVPHAVDRNRGCSVWWRS